MATMTNHKLQAEWFWVDRWTRSSAFCLPQEARGVYREMLTQAWGRGARLPNDHEAIRRVTGTTAKEWAKAWPLIARYWRYAGGDLRGGDGPERFGDDARPGRGDRSARERRRAAEVARRKQGFSTAQALLKHVLKHCLSMCLSRSQAGAKQGV
jgi:uncharacterized protein YdaU (DUF1376 family)